MTERDPHERRNTLHDDLEKIHERLNITDQTTVKLSSVMETLVNAVSKLQDRMDNPPEQPKGPSWAAIGSLAAASCSLIIIIIGGFVTLTIAPIVANQEAMKTAGMLAIGDITTDLREDNIRERTDTKMLATIKADQNNLRANQQTLFDITGSLRMQRAQDDAAEIARLKGVIERQSGLKITTK